MSDAEPTLLLTRPEAQSKAFLQRCNRLAGRELPAVISPVMQIEATDAVPNFDRYATIIFTSGNGVRSAAARGSLMGRTVVTVGDATAMLARSEGAEAEALGETVDAFVEASKRVRSPALFCRGRHSRGDLAERLREKGVRVDELVIYDQVARPLSFAAEALLAGEAPVVAPLFSPRSAELLSQQGQPTAPITVIAMSDAVARAWNGPGEVLVAERPTVMAMADLVVRRF